VLSHPRSYQEGRRVKAHSYQFSLPTIQAVRDVAGIHLG
jgi:hypothetical protein